MESYIQVDGRNAWLIGAHISPYDPASRENHDPKRNRRLLLNKQEIKELNNGIKLKGLTVVPVQMYLKNGRAKLEIALAKGKKLFDKRNSIAKQDLEREILRDTKKRLK
jgi:SsrA-binding protein